MYIYNELEGYYKKTIVPKKKKYIDKSFSKKKKDHQVKYDRKESKKKPKKDSIVFLRLFWYKK